MKQSNCVGSILLVSMAERVTGHSFLIFAGRVRSFIADYGVPLMVVVWTALSFTVPSKLPSGVPRRLFAPLAWESTSLHHWTVIKVINLNITLSHIIPVLDFL